MPIIFIIFLIIFINMLGFGFIIPLTPYIKFHYHLNQQQIGFLSAIFPLAQMIVTPLLGALSDRIGRRYILIICFTMLSLSFLILAYAKNFETIVLSRIIGGVCSGSFVIAMACAADISSKEDRLQYMGIAGMGFGLGFMLGPTFGGIFAGHDMLHANLKLVSIIAFVISMTASILAMIYLPETHPKAKREAGSIITTVGQLFSNSFTLLNFLLSIILNLTLSGIEVYFSIHLAKKFHFSPVQIGLFWMYYAVFMNAGRVVLLKRIKNYQHIAVLFLIMGFSIFGLTISFTVWLGFFFITFQALTSGALVTSINSRVSLRGAPSQQGLFLGVNAGAGNIGRFVGPSFLGSLIHYTGNSVNNAWFFLTLVLLLATFTAFKMKKYDNA